MAIDAFWTRSDSALALPACRILVADGCRRPWRRASGCAGMISIQLTNAQWARLHPAGGIYADQNYVRQRTLMALPIDLLNV